MSQNFYTDTGKNYSFQNPFNTVAHQWMPTNIKEMFKISEWMSENNVTFKAAIDRISRIFVTNFEYTDIENTSNKQNLKNFFEGSSYFKETLICIGKDLLTYGNSFFSLYFPFTRMVTCPVCQKSYSPKQVTLKYNPTRKFHGDCYCGAKDINFNHKDYKNNDITKIRIVRWNPKEIDIVHNRVTGNSIYKWEMSTSERDKYKNSVGTHIIYETPEEILEAAHKDMCIEFDEDNIYHLKIPSLAGKEIEWGTPPALACFPLIFYIAILRKANEAISLDFIIPLRIIFPQGNTSFQEPSYMVLSDFSDQINQIIENYKKDPASWYVAPSPLGYQVMGGEKRSLMITDEIKLANDELLNGMGFPAELFYGTLSTQGTPMALRMLENTFGLTFCYNDVVKWIAKKITAQFNLKETEVTIASVRWADDMERRQMLLNLAAGQQISETTILELYGIDFEKEKRKQIDQLRVVNKLQEEKSREDKRNQEFNSPDSQQGSAGTPQGMLQQAESIAQNMLAMPQEVRRSELDKLQKSNAPLHAMVNQKLKDLRSDAATQGRQMILGQLG